MILTASVPGGLLLRPCARYRLRALVDVLATVRGAVILTENTGGCDWGSARTDTRCRSMTHSQAMHGSSWRVG